MNHWGASIPYSPAIPRENQPEHAISASRGNESEQSMGNDAGHMEVNGYASVDAILPPSPTLMITISPADKGLLWQQQIFEVSHDRNSQTTPELCWTWIVFAMGTTFFLMSIVPLMLLAILTGPSTGLPADITTNSGIVARSLHLEVPSWNYESICKPRKGQCQLGTYTTKNSTTAELSWFNPTCRKVAYDGEAPTKQLAFLNTNDTDPYLYPVVVRFEDPGSYLDVPYFMYGERAYSKYRNEVGGWFGPDSDGEFFSLLWFDC